MTTLADVPIDWSAEFCEASRLMGLKSTNLEQLQNTVALLYLNCPNEFEIGFAALLKQITRRIVILQIGV